ncbi:MAG: VOC family protein [Thermoplasmata archaeon]|jgi:predicted enzyme related to lactoylglutathione lyase|nr:VOC family protein [Thermoplasmata archaeon]
MPKTAKKPAKRSASKSAKKTSAKVVAKPHFSSVAVVVSDRKRSVKWYTESFGLDHLTDMDHWQTVGEKGRPGELHICQVSEYDDKAPMEPGNSGIAFRLRGNFVAACEQLKARGVDFAVPATKSDWGWWAMVKDPDGNEICVVPEE